MRDLELLEHCASARLGNFVYRERKSQLLWIIRYNIDKQITQTQKVITKCRNMIVLRKDSSESNSGYEMEGKMIMYFSRFHTISSLLIGILYHFQLTQHHK